MTGILDLREVVDKDSIGMATLTDLNLNQIINMIAQVWGDKVSHLYGYYPLTAEAEEYRREVLADIESEGVYEIMFEAYSDMYRSRAALEAGNKSKQSIQKHIRYIEEAALYCDAVGKIYEGLKDRDFISAGMKELQNAVSEYCEDADYKAFRDTVCGIRDKLENTRFTLTYENKRVRLSEDPTQEDCESVLRKLYPDNKTKLESPFAGNEALDGLEREIIAIFMRKHPDIYSVAAEYFENKRNFRRDWVERFFDEVPFYLSFIKFERFMESNGASFSMPTVSDEENIRAEGLYDLALYIANMTRGKEVISNDFYYDANEMFFVLTGPNQGGKTTFARSLGQLVFFTKMGLKVPAKAANMHYFTNIVTHFSVEESVETGRGKLMEELVRLSPMMKNSDSNVFVIINELFTTAANYDACIMGKKVLEHFIARGCHGIYVTHLAELLESQEKAVGLCAQLNDKGIQTFKILRSVMEYTNCASNQVDKYELNYAQLKERLKSLKNPEGGRA